MRTLIRAAALALTLTVAGGWAVTDAQMKIAVFDPARVSEEAVDAQKLQADLTAIRDSRQAEVLAKESEVNDMRQRLQQQALSLSIDRREAMEIDIQRRIIALNAMKETANQELQLEFAAAESRFNAKLRQVVDTFAREKGFDVILDVNAVAWSSVAIDITTPIVDKYNQLFPAAPPAGAAGQ
jgi:outer membrane protein